MVQIDDIKGLIFNPNLTNRLIEGKSCFLKAFTNYLRQTRQMRWKQFLLMDGLMQSTRLRAKLKTTVYLVSKQNKVNFSK